MAKKAPPEGRAEFGVNLEDALREAVAYKRGEISLETRIVNPMPASRVREIRKAVAKSPKEFERRFGVPARTLEGWEQGRGIDAAHRVLLTVIERAPDAVEAALGRSAPEA
jgi:putative transcriptional regulator